MQVKIPFLKPDVIDSLKASVSSAEATLSAVNISYQSTFEKASINDSSSAISEIFNVP